MEKKSQPAREETTSADPERTRAVRSPAPASHAEQWDFLSAPEPECLGRPDSQCTGKEHRHGEGHEHGEEHGHGEGHEHGGEHGHGHGHGTGHEHEGEHGQMHGHEQVHGHGGQHGHPPAEQPEPGHGHAHMRVFPVFVMDDEGQLVEVVSGEGKVMEAVPKLQKDGLVKSRPDSEKTP